MEKSRRLASGTLSEVLGEDTIEIDKFMRAVGLRRLAIDSFELMPDSEKDVLKAYADGVNDFVAGIDLYSKDSTAKVFPPEFIAFGIDHQNYTPWTPIDSMAIIKLNSFQVSLSW